jgi:hypothetical protein
MFFLGTPFRYVARMQRSEIREDPPVKSKWARWIPNGNWKHGHDVARMQRSEIREDPPVKSKWARWIPNGNWKHGHGLAYLLSRNALHSFRATD